MEKSNFTLICLHILDGCLEDYCKVLRPGEYYFFNSWYQLSNGIVTKIEDNEFERDFFGKNISVQAVVGKNGSGKSSLFELIYRIINNLSYVTTEGLYRAKASSIYFIKKLRAEIYFEQDGELGRVTCNDDIVEFVYGKEIYYKLKFPGYKNYFDEDEWSNIKEKDVDAKQLAQKHIKEQQENICNDILSHFFFILVMNYSMQSLNPCDYEYEEAYGSDETEECMSSWLMSLYNKNDGYMVPIGFEPYRGNNKIDLRNQKELTEDRVSSLLIDSKKNNNQVFPGYLYDEIYFTLDMSFMYKKKNDDDDLSQNIETIVKNLESQRCKLFTDGFNLSDKHNISQPEPLLINALEYLIDKTFHISENYPGYEKFSGLSERFYDLDEEISMQDVKLVKELIDKIYNESSHIGVKISQTQHFLDGLLLASSDFKNSMQTEGFNYENYINNFFPNVVIDSPEKVMDYYPPPFFVHSIFLKEIVTNSCVEFSELSAGERQFLYTTAGYIYHLRNIISVPSDKSRLKYTNVCLFLDEVELCFHPEYQRTFIRQLLKSLKDNEINESCNVNIIISTHSPFILSDIPKSNILFLHKGKIINDEVRFNPFGSNISDLLADSFFLENGFVGDFAKEKINNLIYYLENGENKDCYEWNEITAKKCIDLIGDPLLYDMLSIAYGKKHLSKEKRIKALENEIKKITNEKN